MSFKFLTDLFNAIMVVATSPKRHSSNSEILRKFKFSFRFAGVL